jgi:hypothetical protein
MLALALAAMLTTTIVAAGVSTLEAGPRVPSSPKPAERATGPWQIRCWQDGRLLFEENGVSLPDNAVYPTLITAADRQGRPVFVAETRNATCLIRPAVVDRGAWPR